MRVLSLFSPSRSSKSTSFRKSLRCWFGSSDRSPWNDVGSKRYHIVPYEELNGIPVAFVARFGVVSKSTDRPMVVDKNG
ncbi:hypothetical protein Tco_0137572, partial [Tanacetum coccineum]